MEEIKQEDIHKLLEHFSRCLYKAAEADSKVRQEIVQWEAHGSALRIMYGNLWLNYFVREDAMTRQTGDTVSTIRNWVWSFNQVNYMGCPTYI